MGTSVKLATRVSYSSTFEKFSFLPELGKRTEISSVIGSFLLFEQKKNVPDICGNVGTSSKMEKGLVKVWDLVYGQTCSATIMSYVVT